MSNKNTSYPECVINVLVVIVERTPTGGATLNDLLNAYECVVGKIPTDRTIYRIISRINNAVDPGQNVIISVRGKGRLRRYSYVHKDSYLMSRLEANIA